MFEKKSALKFVIAILPQKFLSKEKEKSLVWFL